MIKFIYFILYVRSLGYSVTCYSREKQSRIHVYAEKELPFSLMFPTIKQLGLRLQKEYPNLIRLLPALHLPIGSCGNYCWYTVSLDSPWIHSSEVFGPGVLLDRIKIRDIVANASRLGSLYRYAYEGLNPKLRFAGKRKR